MHNVQKTLRKNVFELFIVFHCFHVHFVLSSPGFGSKPFPTNALNLILNTITKFHNGISR